MKYIILLALLTSSMFANQTDIYKLNYNSKTTECTLTKNDKKIDLIDERFEIKPRTAPYTCSTMQKENYKSCKITKQNSVTALALGYGAYEKTNFVLAIQNTHKAFNASVEVECSKTKILEWVEEPKQEEASLK